MNALRFSHWGSIETSSLKHHLSAADRFFVGASLAGILLWTFAPHVAAAQIATGDLTFAFETNDFKGLKEWPLPIFPQEYFANSFLGNRDGLAVPDPRTDLMREYLESKNSPLAGHVETLLKLDHYQLIIGISFAESNFCKRNIRPHNCWGIGGTNPESYTDYDEAVIRANELIDKYQDSGLTNPKLMRDRWVGWKNHNWILAVEQVKSALEERGL